MITYCTNIHSGESWQSTFDNLRHHIPLIKAAVSPDDVFPIGLRLSHRAAHEMDTSANHRFQAWCEAQHCRVTTINGFPYGAFHHTAVKEKVYLPDWRDPARADYTCRLADLLQAWLPQGVVGSISTVPLGFKAHTQKHDLPEMEDNLLTVLNHLEALRQRTGKTIFLALEPEPGCMLETSQEVLAFFERFDSRRAPYDLLGICFDCCHQAVVFENPHDALTAILAAGIPVPKIQISAGLRAIQNAPGALAPFDEPTYLHQVSIRTRDGALHRFDDLPLALEQHAPAPGDEWRTHFHVPVFWDRTDHLGTTRFLVQEVIEKLETDCLLEVETYTWSVLPPELRLDTVTDSIIREIQWVKDLIHDV